MKKEICRKCKGYKKLGKNDPIDSGCICFNPTLKDKIVETTVIQKGKSSVFSKVF